MRRRTTATLLIIAIASTPLHVHSASVGERQRAVHVLNRLAFGPASGDVEWVLAMGIDRYIQQQLTPGSIEDGATEARLARYTTLHMSDADLVKKFIQPQMEARRARRSGDEQVRRPAPEQRPMRVALELTAAKLERAIHSKRQLNEVMVDFWLNHFNVFAGKGLDRVLIAGYERDAIRPHVWGRFEDLLLATAKAPAMLFYLDNARSIAPPEARSGSMARRARQGGLNENYARELLELHTLGVDGGYTQKDVTELARVLTGWSIARPQEGGSGFVFRAALHDRGAKELLGQRLPAGGGMDEGERMIRFLATHPSTAKHIARKLAQKFVSEAPPQPLVDRVAARFLATRGDLRETVRAVITSPEFFAPQNYGTKVKTPFEYVVSAARATNASVTDALGLARVLRDLGQPLYFAQPPTGYSEESADWVSSGALVNRVNFALALAESKVPGVRISAEGAGDLDTIALRLLGRAPSPATRSTVAEKVNAAAPDKRMQLATALIIGSPEFQKQ